MPYNSLKDMFTKEEFKDHYVLFEDSHIEFDLYVEFDDLLEDGEDALEDLIEDLVEDGYLLERMEYSLKAIEGNNLLVKVKADAKTFLEDPIAKKMKEAQGYYYDSSFKVPSPVALVCGAILVVVIACGVVRVLKLLIGI